MEDDNLIFKGNVKQLESRKNMFKELSENIFRFFEKLIVTSVIYYVAIKSDSTVLQIISGLLMVILIYHVSTTIEYSFFNLKIKAKHKTIHIIVLLAYIAIIILIMFYTYLTVLQLAHSNSIK